ncbi:MAG: PGPGW domain-containing protein [Actinomycetota bacterium]|nr:PGPGW domain-containing protein [Actinomycetota bacterium]
MGRIVRISAGVGLVIVGIFLLVLPGPGILTILAGLALLSKHIPAVERLADWIKARFSKDDAANSGSEPD